MRNKCRGQSSLEYAIVIICLAAGLFAMQPYLQKAFQGRLRQQADELGQQYDPEKTSGTLTMTNKNTTKMISKTYDETQIKDLGGNLDIDGDGEADFTLSKEDWDLDEDGSCEADVFATFTKSVVKEGIVTQDGTETIKP